MPSREQRLVMEGIAFALCAFAVGFACSLAPGLEPTVTPEPTPIATPAPPPTPRHVALPPAEILADMIMAEVGGGFRYLPWHYVPDDTTAWLIFGWPEQDDRLYRAVFGVEGGEWVLLDVGPVGEEGREAWGNVDE